MRLGQNGDLAVPGPGTIMSTADLILVCDHRGEGTSSWVAPLATAGYRLESTGNLRQTLLALTRGRPAVIVIDPLASGGEVELDAIARCRPQEPPTPVLVVADAQDPRPTVVGTRTLETGLWDLVYRDAPIEEFLMRIKGLQVRQRQMSETQAEMQELRHRAYHDDLTELLRGETFRFRVREHFSAAQRHGLDMALLHLDLDDFGAVNKEHDHLVGNYLIEKVGGVIQGALRAEDVAGRLGGDEFGVLLPYTRKIDAATVLQRLLSTISDLSGRPPGAKGEISVSASVGFETFNGRDLDTVDTLLRHTEEALHEAKRRGGNRGVYYRDLRRYDPSDDAGEPPRRSPR